MELLGPLLGSLMAGVPGYLVMVATLIIAMSRWQQHPRVSMYAAGGAGTLLVIDVLSRTMMIILQLRLVESGRSAADMGLVFSVASIVSSVLHAIALGVLAAAVFVDRNPSRQV